MTQTRSEQLFELLFDAIDELSELESAELIFDSIVDHLAEQTEYHMGQADAFKGMLDAFRHDNPSETIPEEDELDLSVTANPPRPEELYGGINDINKAYLLEDRDNLLDFIQNIHFPGKLDS